MATATATTKTTNKSKRGRPSASASTAKTGTLSKPKTEDFVHVPGEQDDEDEEEDDEEDDEEDKQDLNNKAKKAKKTPLNSTKAATKNTAIARKKNTVRQTATASTMTAASGDIYTKSVKFFAGIKPTSDLYVQVSYQSLTINVSPTVKAEFFQVLADGSKNLGFIYNQNGRTVYIYGVTPNYDINTVLDAIQKAAGLYGLKTEVIGGTPIPVTDLIQRQIQGIVHSLLPGATIAA